ncbi:MAG TPA: class I SAM-dependent methyltransferase [Verrucomicrobiae bacterium]|nr:class I SAM-dependent methyltransferase [Verrucomicrobiae bacterium]
MAGGDKSKGTAVRKPIRGWLQSLKRSILWFSPSHRRAYAIVRQRDAEFDGEWGVDTSGILAPPRSGSNWAHAVRYEGCRATDLEKTLRTLESAGVTFSDYTFVDFGAGKGRAVLVACRFPFQKVQGVEYSAELCDVARANLQRFPDQEKRCRAAEIVCADASECSIPDGQLVIFLFNPFGEPVMKRLIENIIASGRKSAPRIILIYFRPEFGYLWKEAGFVELPNAPESASIYEFPAPQAGA